MYESKRRLRERIEGLTAQRDMVRDQMDKKVADKGVAARRETLATVIDALELKEYRQRYSTDAHAASLLAGVWREIEAAPLDRFWNDLQTTLRVRAEKAQREADEKTAEKVAGLTKPEAPKATGGLISNPTPGGTSFNSQLNTMVAAKPVRLSQEDRDLLAKVASVPLRTDASEDARPDGEVKIITQPVSEPAKSKKVKK